MKTVTIYLTNYCPYCVNAKRLLDDIEVPYETVDLTDDQELRSSLSQKTGMRTVPMIFIGDECIGGYTELAELQSSGKLQELLGS